MPKNTANRSNASTIKGKTFIVDEGIKLAGLYIRTSSEVQGEKVSPEVQEADCRALCEAKGYIVVEVYRDIAAYRVGGRMVEPSGTRADRPQLRRMLKDAIEGKINHIVAWREDRLYRSYRPMLDVLETIDKAKITVELVKEVFDARFAPVKAWAAKMELDAKNDRTELGITGRFAEGKVWAACIPYGYAKGADGRAVENPVESKWVKLIWKLRAEHKSVLYIRQRLIEGGAPQRRHSQIRFPWHYRQIRDCISLPIYYTGIQIITWRGTEHVVPFPILIDEDTAQRVNAYRERLRQHPAKHVKHHYLLMGLIHCKACGNVMSARTQNQWRHGKKTDTLKSDYRCPVPDTGDAAEGCAKRIGIHKAENAVWAKVLQILEHPEEFEAWVEKRAAELMEQENEAATSVERIKGYLAAIEEERQTVITYARKKVISEADMEKQLADLDNQAREYKAELNNKQFLLDGKAKHLVEFAHRYHRNLRAKLEWLKGEPANEAEKDLQFQTKRDIVLAMVENVWVYADRSVTVDFAFDLSQGETIKTPLRS